MVDAGQQAAAQAAARLLEARQAKRPLRDGLPDGLRPKDFEAGYLAQVAHLAARGGQPIGYKVAATSERAQAALGVPGPFYGRLLQDSSVLDSPRATWPAKSFLVGLIEPEFAVRLGDDLPEGLKPYDRETVAQAVATLHPAIEIVDSAFGRDAWMSAGATSLIADNAVHGAFLLGPGTSDFQGMDLVEHEVSLSVDGQLIGTGFGANAMGHPFDVLAWLANTLVSQGDFLRAGELVTTGVVTPFVYLERGQTATADFGSLGTLAISFS